MQAEYRYTFPDPGPPISPKIFDDGRTVILCVGERGISLGTRVQNGHPQHLVYFVRHGSEFSGKQHLRNHMLIWQAANPQYLVPVWEAYLTLGAPFRPTAEKLSGLQTVTAPSMDAIILEWSNQGSLFDRYVKTLWIAIKAQKPKLEALGIDPEIGKKIFAPQFFVPTIDKVCRRKLTVLRSSSLRLQILTPAHIVFRPSFRRAMEAPNQTPAGLISACEKLTPTWPADGDGAIYVRVYTQLDDETDRDNAGIYVGWTIHATDRDNTHRRAAKTGPLVPLNARATTTSPARPAPATS